MKTIRLFNILLASVTLLIGSVAFAQAGAPNGINYQAVIRKSDGTLVSNTPIAVRASIRQTTATGTVIFSERHNVTTDQWGLVNFVIGTGTFLSGSPFANISWGNGPYFLDLGVAFSGLPNPTIYMPYGTQQMMSVPFALYAKSSGNLLNQWSYGAGAPLNNAGNMGDYYLDTSTGNVYNKINGTTWVLITNITGPQGSAGAAGPQGPAGVAGPIGLTGPQGIQGIAGPIGLTGATGATGATGPAGVAGPQGIQGVAGTNGLNGTNGTAVLNGNTNPTAGTGVNGDFYINTTTNTLFGPKANGTWPAGVSLVGPQGAQGIQGLTGATGPIGLTGPAGAAGPQGPIGLTGPAGAQGIQGVAGPAGPAGASGLLSSGNAAGNTPYWNGSQWIVNGTNLYNNGGNLGVGTTTPHASALTDLTSTTQGFLPPRMTTVQRNAIASPAIGLVIYNTTVNCLQWWNGTVWYDGCGNNAPPAASLTTLNCGSASTTGTLTSGQAASNVSVSVPYTGGNAGTYSAQSVSSTGVTGLTASLGAGTLANGNGSVTYTITGTPASSGTATFAITLGGQSCNLTVSVAAASPQYPANSVFCAGATAIVDVLNPTTGVTWMDRNLGATQVATSSTDQAAYGDLYQWGRRADGHQCRTSPTTATLSSVDQPAHGNFITINSGNYDWRSPQNANLWQGVNGVNNPCPSGYRIPTETEINDERLSWSVNTSVGAFASPLKWTLAGYRYGNNGALGSVGSGGLYWSSTVSGAHSQYLDFTSSNAVMTDHYRAYCFTVRCIKEIAGALGALNCGGSTTAGNLFSGSVASNVSASVPYTGGNGGYYAAQTTASTGVTGLTATLSQGVLINGAGSLNFTISGTPASAGSASFAITLGGQSCSFTVSVGVAIGQYPPGTVHCAGVTTVVDVTNPTTGRIWMDRNLGATQVATSSTDANSYGDLYQWGRRADGHQCRTSPTTATLSSVDQPAHGNFILAPNAPYDWRSPQNANLWQGVNGVNNPCPSGYRIPTETEINAERLSWSVNTSVGAFASPLKWTLAGNRDSNNGTLTDVGSGGHYWSSTVSGTGSRALNFNSSAANVNDYNRAYGLTLRCIKN